MSIRDDLRTQWRTGGMLVRLILINAAVFLALLLVDLVVLLSFQNKASADVFFHDQVLGWLASSYAWKHLLFRPWTVITYMFTHAGFWHLFWNIMVLWFSGRMFQDLLGEKRLLGTYLLGGLAGLVLYALAYNFAPFLHGYTSGGTIIGASAAVMGVLFGIAVYRPTLQVSLIFIGPVKLIYVALVLLVLDLIGIRQGVNSGGHIAHLGGAFYGYLYAKQLAQGRDWSLAFGTWVEGLLGLLQRRRGPKLKVAKGAGRRRPPRDDVDYNARKQEEQAQIDAILDKIGKSGYESLSKEEKDLLFRASHER